MEKIKSKKILVVGGTGFIGSHLVKKCLEIGWKVTSLSLKKRKLKKKNKNLKYIFADFTKIDVLKKKIKFDFDYIVNLGGYIDHSNEKQKNLKILNNHFYSTVNLISLNKKKIKKYLHIGSSDEYGQNKSPVRETFREDAGSTYALAKSMSSNLLLSLYKEKKFPATIIRLFLVYGPNQKRDRLIPYVIFNSLKGKPINLSKGNQLRDFCYIDDVIDAIILCLKSKKANGHIFNVGSGKPITVKDIVKKIVTITGNGNLRFNKKITKKKENLQLYPSIKKIRSKIGWKQKTSLDIGLKKTINFYKNILIQ